MNQLAISKVITYKWTITARATQDFERDSTATPNTEYSIDLSD